MPKFTVENQSVRQAFHVELTAIESKLHERALALSRRQRETEALLCECLREVDRANLFRKLGHVSLFDYAVKALQLPESVAYAMITVARKSAEIRELKSAIEARCLSVSKASRIVSGLTTENAVEVVAFAQNHTSREIDREMARRNPERAVRDRLRPVDENGFEIKSRISKSIYDKLLRTQVVLASKGKPTTLEGVLNEALEAYLDRHDSLRKAERAIERKRRKMQSEPRSAKSANSEQSTKATHSKRSTQSAKPATSSVVEGSEVSNRPVTETRVGSFHLAAEQATPHPGAQVDVSALCVDRATDESEAPTSFSAGASSSSQPRGNETKARRRRRIKSETHHEVIHQSGGRCTFVNERGERCEETRWVQQHHIRHVARGGGDEASNLTVLCPNHHDLIHQLSLPMDGQITWLRTRQVAYWA